ncbi:MAG: efflux transporter outer membrane subunit [Novosphingobium sp.]|nr:efflux transporter outer membrane subunit [Novosphingobium sp.]
MARRLLRGLVAALPAFLAACTVGPNFKAPAPPAPTAGYAPVATLRATFGEGPQLRWWETFGNPRLNALVERALAGNKSLEASNATLARARERIAAVAGQRLPQIDANARVEHQQVNLSAFGLDPSSFGGSLGNPEFTLYTVGGGVRYDLDPFGKNRRSLEQTRAEAEAQLRQTEAAHLTIAGRVVNQVLTIAALDDRIAAAQELIAENRRNVALTDRKRRGGEGTLVEVLSAESQLTADQAGLPALEQQRAEARDMLALLIGVSPAELGPTDFALAAFALPTPVPVAVPSALVHKRPDILASEAQLHAATAAVGVATANLYPDISLGATLTQSSTDLGSLLSSGSRGFDIFGGLMAPIFHGGTLRAERRGAEAGMRAAAATYQQTVLEAFTQVSDLLAALGNDAATLANQQQAADVAARSLQLSRRSYEVGNSGVLQVLDASRAYQRARLAVLDARSRQYLDIARLYVATAGGWTGPAAVPAAAP